MEYSEGMTPEAPWLQGTVKVGRKTELLMKTVKPGAIAVIEHDDLDEHSALNIVRSGIIAVINAGKTMSGRVDTKGPLLLLKYGTPVFEINRLWFPFFRDGMNVTIDECGIWAEHVKIPYTRFGFERWQAMQHTAKRALNERLDLWIDRTLQAAAAQKHLMQMPLACPYLRTKLEGRHVMVVSNGWQAADDINVLRPYIRKQRPAFIGVNEGADKLLALGLKPDFIVGEPERVSVRARECGADLVALKRSADCLRETECSSGDEYFTTWLSFEGTSEDAALLLAHECGALVIVHVGSLESDKALLEKGSSELGSALLVRMKARGKLMDATGICRLLGPSMQSAFRYRKAAAIVSAAAAAASALWLRTVKAASPAWSGLMRRFH